MGNNYFTRKNIVATIVTFFTILGVFAQATLVSDQSDYSPGSTATFIGDGFQPGEFVKIQVLHADDIPNTGEDHEIWFVTANVFGSFTTTWHVCEDDCLGSTLRAYADGQSSGLQTYVQFTDAAPWTITVSPSSSVCTGTSNIFTFTITSGGNGSGSIGCLKVAVPSTFGSLGTPSITSTTASGGVAAWSISLSSGIINVNASSNAARLGTGQTLTFTIQATATTSTGSPFTWTTTGTENTNCSATITNPNPTSQPTVSVNPGPVLTVSNLPASGNINNLTGTCGASVAFGANVSAVGSPSPTITYSLSNFGATITSPQVFPVGITTVWVKASNSCGQDIKSFTVTVKDTQNPVITCPTNIVKNNDTGVCGAVTTYTVGSSDNCSGQILSQTAGLASGSVFPVGTTTNSFLVTDVSGNTATCSFTVKVNDTENPTIVSLPLDIEVGNDAGVCGATVNWTTPTSSDNCTGHSISQTAGVSNGGVFPVGTTLVSYTALDTAGHSVTSSFNVKVNDTENPTIVSLPLDIEVGNDAGVCGATVNWTAPTSSDNCTGHSISQTAGVSNGGVFPVGTTLVSYTALDTAGHSVTESFNVKVNDTENPSIVGLPLDIEVSNDAGVCGATVNWTAPTSSDNCTGHSISQTVGVSNGGVFPVGTTLVTYTALDAAGHSVTESFNVKVNDTENPTIVSLPLDIEVGNDAGVCGATVNWTAPTSSDNCSGHSISQTAGVSNGGVFPVGTTLVSYTALDTAGHSVTESFNVKVNDTENPSIVSLPLDIEVSNDTGVCGATVNWTAPTSSDNCSGHSISQTVGVSNGGVFPVGTTLVSYTALDTAGHSVTESFNVKVNDTENPSIVSLPLDIEVSNDTGVCGATVNWTAPTSSDNCSGHSISQTAGVSNGSVFPVGTTLVSYTALDTAGHSVTESFNVKVNDTENPTIVSLPLDIEVANDAGVCGATVNWTAPTSSDNCSGHSISQTVGVSNGSVFPVGTTLVSYTALDTAGHSVTESFNVKVNDTENPTIVSLPLDIEVGNDAGVCGATVNWTAPTSSDNCSGHSISQTVGVSNGGVFPVGTTLVSYTALDTAGHSVTESFNVKVNDTENPTIVSLPLDIEVSNDAGVCGATVNWTAPTSSDNCSGHSISQTVGVSNGGVFPVGTTLVSYTALDTAGHSVTSSFNVKVNDTENPVITCPTNIVKSNDAGICGAVATYTVGSSDNCSGQIVTQTAGLASGSVFPVGTTTNSFLVTDASGNTATCSFTVKVNDTQNPVITCPTNIVKSNDAGVCGAVATYTVGSSDNCSGQIVTQTAGLASGSVFPVGTTTNSFLVTDASGNTATCSFTVKVNDTQNPVITCPTNIVKSNDTGVCGAVATYTVGSSDNCSGQIVTQTAGLVSGSVFPVGTTTNSFLVTDASGNTATCSFTVKVNDTQNPVITCPANIVKSNDTGVCGAVATYTVGSSDNCSGQIVTQTAGLVSGSVFPVGTTTNSFLVTDASGNTATCSFTVKVNDTQNPVITCPANKTAVTDAGLCTKTYTIAEIGSPTYSDNCSATVSWIRSDSQVVLNAPFNFGSTTITWTAKDPTGNVASCVQTININQVSTAIAVTVTASSQQYSDKVTFVATVTPNNCGVAGAIGGSVEFKVGTQSMGSAPVINGVATLPNVSLLEPTPFGTLPTGQLSPGTKTVKACFTGTDSDYIVSNPTTTLETTKENTAVDYTGQDFASTGTATSTSSLVRLSATIRDITAISGSGDLDGGDIRNAKAKFKLRGINPSNGSEVIAEFSTESINVSLLALDVKVGSVLKDITLSIPGSLDSVIYEIKLEVDGYYNNSTAVIGTLTLSKSLNDFVTFGGNLKMTPNTSSGYYPSNIDSKINFGGSVKYNKNGTNMQGGVNIIWRTGTKVYQIKGIVGGSNGSMSVNVTNANEKKAVVNAKANVYDTETGLAVANTSGAIVTLNLVDKGEPGVNDQISIELRNGAGTLLLSSNWTGVKTDLLTLTGGNIQVKSSTNNVSTVSKVEIEETISDVKLAFNVKAYPNPSSQFFNLNIEGNDGEVSEVTIYNSAGILIEQFKGKVNQEYQIGDRWASGIYLVQIQKGMEIKTIKLIKRN